MNFGALVLAPIALVGHASLWVPIWNRVESTAMPRWLKGRISRFAKIACILLPPLTILGFALGSQVPTVQELARGYTIVCIITALLVVPTGIVRRFTLSYITGVRSITSRVERVTKARLASCAKPKKRDRVLFNFPGNQCFEFDVNRKEIEIPRLVPELDGLTIAHLTDLHFTGAIDKSYFDRAIDCINQMQPDIVAITGDLVDNPRLMRWLPDTIGRLRARHGVYVIFGNHDCKQNLSQMREMMTDLDICALGGRLVDIQVRGQRIVLAGNELPWIVPATDMTQCFSRDTKHLRILLSHSPDQIEWARYHDFDLMLAGHTHGGQFRLPWFGAMVCPSSRSLAFASGVFYEAPTLLHVSRGLSGEVPLRLNCRPEITELVLRCPQLVYQEHRHREEIKELTRIQKQVEYYVPNEFGGPQKKEPQLQEELIHE